MSDVDPARRRRKADGEGELVAEDVEERDEAQDAGQGGEPGGPDDQAAAAEGNQASGERSQHAGGGSGAQDDARSDERAPIELKVEYKRLNTFFYDYTKNISRGGTFIRTRKPLDVGTLFAFRLHVPKLPEPLSLLGEVRWILRAEEARGGADHEPGMGIRFIYDNDEQRYAIERSVEKLMVSSLGQVIYAGLKGRKQQSP